MLLNYYLSYPSTEHAKMHRQANRLGLYDVNKEERYNRISKQVRTMIGRTIMRTNKISNIYVDVVVLSYRANNWVFASTNLRKFIIWESLHISISKPLSTSPFYCSSCSSFTPYILLSLTLWPLTCKLREFPATQSIFFYQFR